MKTARIIQQCCRPLDDVAQANGAASISEQDFAKEVGPAARRFEA